MTETIIVLRGEKNAEIIRAICELYHIDSEKATDIFFRSDIVDLIENGIADLHCRSSKYLATLIMEEYMEPIQ